MFKFFTKKSTSTPHKEIEKIIRSIKKEKRHYIYSANDLNGLEAYVKLKQMGDDEKKNMVLELIDHKQFISLKHINDYHYDSSKYEYYAESISLAILSGLLRSKLNYSETEWTTLFEKIAAVKAKLQSKRKNSFRLFEYPINYIIKQIEYTLKGKQPSEELKAYIKQLLTWEEFKEPDGRHYFGSDLRKAVNKLNALIKSPGEIDVFRLETKDIGPEVNNIVSQLNSNTENYHRIFDNALKVSGSKPSAKYLKQINEDIDTIGLDNYRNTLFEIFQVALTIKPRDVTTQHTFAGDVHEYTETVYLDPQSQNFIKGLVWTCRRFSDKETILTLSTLCEKSFTKIPGKGPSAASIGNACILLLGQMRGKDGLGALSRLKLKIRQNNVKKSIDKYLLEGSKKYNVSVEELKEMAVPDYKLVDGSKSIAFDDYTLEIKIEGNKTTQKWIKPDGSLMKSVPSFVKTNAAYTSKLNNVRKEVKEIQKVYSAQKQRIDNQLILGRTWDYVSFKKHYLHHGLVCVIANKLIWNFTKDDQSENCILLENQWHTVDHDLVDWIDDETVVKLWHPVDAGEAQIVQWRRKIVELEWKQQIKQAFRELYILTDAEINTKSYSNRMAAHIIKQHQFSTLANLRDWKYSLMGWYDDGRENEICSKEIPEHGIRAEFWIDEINQEDAYNDAGIWLYVTTDQVRFINTKNDEVMDLINVPKLVFTEVMRDVDLFVGVSSVGNDPQWMDNNGDRQLYRDYWTSYSFGDLTEIAKSRKEILEGLLPRLSKIRDKARIDGKFVIVKGQLRTYKIHIGSGNILMEPNDQYLCIVPSRSANGPADKLYIPFEGDRGLSIVLSKAFLLAEDDKITDSTILSQIK